MNKKQELALRKELLVMRAAIERAELAEQIATIRHPQQTSWWRKGLQFALPGLLKGRGAGVALAVVRKLPALLSASSFLVSKTKHPIVLRGLRWAGIGVAVWQALKWWRSGRDH
ncbi:hypothetical protein [Parvibium lacunae]|uniref:DUF3318 domain-containing protein n=1 Tax=Parvibium lacunae TaxID=1888893 RepID=A0A368L1W8_9BURK|nr:hypothetical protein [Parvibium lacunae]RCS57512.1 hypothetical protein DU000_08675 [Parvibium lacunae]